MPRFISCKAGRDYFIDGIFWGDDEEGVILYLKAKGVSPMRSRRHWQQWRRQEDISSSKRTSRSLSSNGCEGLLARTESLQVRLKPKQRDIG